MTTIRLSDPISGGITVSEAAPGVLLAVLHTGELGELKSSHVESLAALVDRAEHDDIRAVVITGDHPTRFVSHASIEWLQRQGQVSHAVTSRRARLLTWLATRARRNPIADRLLARTPMAGALTLDRLHDTFLRMNCSGAVFVAALNGTALGVGAELAWACDFRIMATGDHGIGQLEVLLGFPPGGGGTQRLPRLIGRHNALRAMLDGGPLSVDQALAQGAIDQAVASADLITHAVALGQYYGARPKNAVRQIKQLVYLGGSETLPAGLRRERVSFVAQLAGPVAQQLCLAYQVRTRHDGELPMYEPLIYQESLLTGHLAGVRLASPGSHHESL